jgi:hypothetical protein
VADTPLETRFAVLCQIVRAQHFAWREAVRQACPDVDPAEVVDRMWALTGEGTAASYLEHLDPSAPLALQAARSVAFSSRCMGEDASVEEGQDGEALVRHADCPWFHWHKRKGLLAEDRAGCDRWFQETTAGLAKALGVRLQVETLATLPDGDDSCLRRFSVARS